MAYSKEHYMATRDQKIQKSIEWQQINKVAHNNAVKRYSEKNPDVGAAATKRYREKHKHTLEYRQRACVNKSRQRAKQKGWEHDIDLEYIQSIWPADNRCPVFGTEFTYGNDSLDTNASVDRIDSSKGYIKGNVCVISWRANNIKSNATVSELEAVLLHMKSLISEPYTST